MQTYQTKTKTTVLKMPKDLKEDVNKLKNIYEQNRNTNKVTGMLESWET